jgi:redox-sensitive bicupin YhaK (pirin superfamily)
MIDVRPFAGLAHRDHGWLDTRYHFSFSDYHDPERMGWGKIRVWNDDKIAPKAGFPPHGHNDMEIITFVRSGAVSHKDSLGNEGRTGAGDVQVMSAGKGVVHAEYNLEDEDTTLFQIWIMPDSTGGEPDWGMREFPRGERSGKWEVVASGNPDGDAALPLRSDAKILAATLSAGERVTYKAAPWRHQYLVAATGSVRVNGAEARTRDGVAITGEETIEIEALEDTELVMVDAR